MDFMDGMTAAEKIRQLDSEFVIMFIINLTQYAVRGYEVDALDYVVKPVEGIGNPDCLFGTYGKCSKKAIWISLQTRCLHFMKLGLYFY